MFWNVYIAIRKAMFQTIFCSALLTISIIRRNMCVDEARRKTYKLTEMH